MHTCTKCKVEKPRDQYYTRKKDGKEYRMGMCKPCYRPTVKRPAPKGLRKTKRIDDRMTIGQMIDRHKGSPMCQPWV